MRRHRLGWLGELLLSMYRAGMLLKELLHCQMSLETPGSIRLDAGPQLGMHAVYMQQSIGMAGMGGGKARSCLQQCNASLLTCRARSDSPLKLVFPRWLGFPEKTKWFHAHIFSPVLWLDWEVKLMLLVWRNTTHGHESTRLLLWSGQLGAFSTSLICS